MPFTGGKYTWHMADPALNCRSTTVSMRSRQTEHGCTRTVQNKLQSVRQTYWVPKQLPLSKLPPIPRAVKGAWHTSSNLQRVKARDQPRLPLQPLSGYQTCRHSPAGRVQVLLCTSTFSLWIFQHAVHDRRWPCFSFKRCPNKDPARACHAHHMSFA